jgi:ribosomal protein L10
MATVSKVINQFNSTALLFAMPLETITFKQLTTLRRMIPETAKAMVVKNSMMKRFEEMLFTYICTCIYIHINKDIWISCRENFHQFIRFFFVFFFSFFIQYNDSCLYFEYHYYIIFVVVSLSLSLFCRALEGSTFAPLIDQLEGTNLWMFSKEEDMPLTVRKYAEWISKHRDVKLGERVKIKVKSLCIKSFVEHEGRKFFWRLLNPIYFVPC